ncbi:MAG: cellulase family glycosylhydrolase [Nitrososphaerales archaeon]
MSDTFYMGNGGGLFSSGTRVLFIAAAISASVALGLTVGGVWSLKPYNPGAPPAPVCPMGYEFKDGDCSLVTQPIACPAGYYLEGDSCFPEVVPTCPDGYILEGDRCVAVQPTDPEPQPDPDPAPAVIPYSELHGVNYIDSVLMRKQGTPALPVQREVIRQFVPIAAEAGFNVFRVPVGWESYVDNKENFLGELVALVETANSHDIFVFVEVFQFEATSNWGDKVSTGRGFPEFIVSCYQPLRGYEYAPEVEKFWNDYYLNKVLDSSNSCQGTIDAWDLHAEFLKTMIEEIDHYPNVIGYGILNEPHVWKDSDYDRLGDMHTAIAKKLRTSTDKVIIFTRETPHGLGPDGKKYVRQVGLEYKILPRDPKNNVMYVPHIYDIYDIEGQVDRWKEVQKRWKSMGYDVGIAVGEWSPQPPQLPVSYGVNQMTMDGFVKVWAREGWMHAYWAFGGFNFAEGNVLVKQSGTLTAVGQYYVNSIEKYYE